MAKPKLTLRDVRSCRYSPHYDVYVDRLLAQRRHIESTDPGGPTPNGLLLAKESFSTEQAAQWGALIETMLADGSN